jgi:hypothetical protein
MKQLVFKTVDGVELYVDTETKQYETTDWVAIESALKTDIDNEDIDPYAAKMALNLLHDLVAQARMTNHVRQSF